MVEELAPVNDLPQSKESIDLIGVIVIKANKNTTLWH